MSRAMRRVAAAVVVLFALGAVAWAWRMEIALGLVRAAMERRLPTGPPREIAWSSGIDPLGRTTGERPPNIVLILADDLGWNDLTFAGGGVAGGSVPTPHIDSIAAEGVSFTHGYAGNATCAPSRAALLSGRYATRFGFEFTPTPGGMMQIVPRLGTTNPRLREPILHDDVERLDFDDMGMPASEVTIAELLAARGYHTASKRWHLEASNGMAAHDQDSPRAC
ncbi:MAG: sulfatase-like hydrolase/transferase [Myxococcota bacterium]